MHHAQADVEATGTQLFAEDEPLGYLARLVESRDIEFTELGGVPRAFDPFDSGKVLQTILGGIS